MDEKLKKTLKTSKQGVWLLIILTVILNVLSILNASSILAYLQNSWVSIIYLAGLITGLMLYGKEKYTTGGEVIQWTALGNIIVTVANFVITYVITEKFVVEIIPLLVGTVVPIILIIEALKVIRLTEEEGHVNKVTVPAIIIIAVIVIINIVSAVKVKQELDDIMAGIKDQINNEIANKEDTNKEENKQDEEKEDKQEDKEPEKEPEQEPEKEPNKEPEKIDPYKDYQSIVWAGKTAQDTNIKNNKLYFNNKEVKINISGTLKSVHTIIIGGFPTIYVLTEEGKAWCIGLDDIVYNTISSKQQLLSNKKILDMVALKTYTNKYSDTTVYFLTEDAKLIDEKGVSYNKYNFVSSLKDFSQDGYISFDKNNYGYYYNESKNTYSVIVSKSNSAKLTFSKVYAVGQKLLVQTAYNKLFEYTWTGNKATQVGGTIASIKKTKNGDAVNLVITFEDGLVKTYNNVTYGWNIKTNKEIDLNSLATYIEPTWSDKTSLDTEIKDNQLYLYNKPLKIKAIGTLKSVETYLKGGFPVIYVLTEEGKAWRIYIDNIVTLDIYDERQILENEKITNMGLVKTNTSEGGVVNNMYFKTSDGRIIIE